MTALCYEKANIHMTNKKESNAWALEAEWIIGN